MRFLVDTHDFLWFIRGDRRLKSNHKKLIADLSNEAFLSIASLWEIAIKSSIGKLSIDSTISNLVHDHVVRMNVTVLPATFEHLDTIQRLPLLHRDPFDRLIIAQSIVEDLPIMTVDSSIEMYDVRVIR